MDDARTNIETLPVVVDPFVPNDLYDACRFGSPWDMVRFSTITRGGEGECWLSHSAYIFCAMRDTLDRAKMSRELDLLISRSYVMFSMTDGRWWDAHYAKETSYPEMVATIHRELFGEAL